jgi:hypothetical protein
MKGGLQYVLFNGAKTQIQVKFLKPFLISTVLYYGFSSGYTKYEFQILSTQKTPECEQGTSHVVVDTIQKKGAHQKIPSFKQN